MTRCVGYMNIEGLKARKALQAVKASEYAKRKRVEAMEKAREETIKKAQEGKKEREMRA